MELVSHQSVVHSSVAVHTHD